MDTLLLLSGEDIPFPEGSITIHQPKLKEIALISEHSFFQGCGMLTVNKNQIILQDKNDLTEYSNFDIFMSMIIEKNENDFSMKKKKIDLQLVLTLLFPEYNVKLTPQGIIMVKDKELRSITQMNFEAFVNIIKEMFCLNGDKKDELNYNPANAKAQEIANKLLSGRAKATASKGEHPQSASILARYASILAIANHQSLNDLMNYTVYQLYDELNRYELKSSNDIYISAKMAGAKDLKEVDNWMKDLHS